MGLKVGLVTGNVSLGQTAPLSYLRYGYVILLSYRYVI